MKPHAALWRIVLVVVASTAWFGMAAVGQVSKTSATTFPDFQELSESVDFALYLAKAAVESPDPADAEIYLAELRERLTLRSEEEGAGLVEQLRGFREAVRIASQDDGALIEVAQMLDSAIRFMSLCLHRVEHALAEGTPSESAQQHAAEAYALLLAARGDPQSPFALGGVRGAIAGLPDAIITIEPGDSVQQAIDRVLPGGTIILKPGTYELQESLRMRSSMTLMSESTDANDVVLAMGSREETALIVGQIGSEVANSIRIANLTVIGGRIGISVASDNGIIAGGSHDVSLMNVTIQGASLAALYVTSGVTTARNCRLENAGQFGLASLWLARITMTDCEILRNGDPRIAALAHFPTSGVLVSASSHVELVSCSIRSSGRYGVSVEENGWLSLHGCEIQESGSDGIVLWDQATLLIEECTVQSNIGWGLRAHSPDCTPSDLALLSMHYHTGALVGTANAIPGPDEPHGNLFGAVCPADDDGSLTSR